MKKLKMIALRGLTVFPNTTVNFDVAREPSLKALQLAANGDMQIFLLKQKNGNAKVPTKLGEMEAVGTIANIKHVMKGPATGVRVLVEGVCRARVANVVKTKPYLEVEVEELPTVFGDEAWETALARKSKSLFLELAKYEKTLVREVVDFIATAEDNDLFSDLVANVMPSQDKQKYLDELDLGKRLTMLLEDLISEIEVGKLHGKIDDIVKDRIEKSQKEYYLREQLRAIHDELGDDGEESDEIKEKIDALNAPADVKDKLLKEWRRMGKLSPMSPEMTVQRNYLEFATELPWGVYTDDDLDISKVEKILNRDHFGMEKIKERILEYLAVKKLSKDKNAPVLCLVGPPGVGKTSIVKSIAEAVGRKYVRISLGGMHDEAEIRGHRKTYVGAMSGRILTGIKNAGCANPVFLLDEIDKLGSDYKGDPSSALLEVLDPEQNYSFRDNFLELPFDLSKVMFITTANSPDLIPPALYDRMEVVEITGYTEEEKFQIAKRHLVPKQLVSNGVKGKVKFENTGIKAVIEKYTRESGVRNLEREIGRVCARCAKRILESDEEVKISVNAKNLHEFLGTPKFMHSDGLKRDEVGAATGLAWTAVGGETLTIEVSLIEGKGDVILTGHLGDVMKESARIALSCVRGLAEKFGVDNERFKEKDIHIHVPEGATPKDGPSAGITMATAIMSAFSGIPVKKSVAMTGEITLRGNVLEIGGLKEKSLAALRAGVKTLIIPEENRKDVADLPESVRNAVEIVNASRVEEVLKTALKRDV